MTQTNNTNQYNEYPDGPRDPSEGLTLMADDRFEELTGGLAKGDMHPMMQSMRRVGSVSFDMPYMDAEPVHVDVQPGNMENGALFPQLTVTTESASTTFISFGGKRLSAKVQLFGTDATVDASLETGAGVQVQDEVDFMLIPSTHWDALKFVKEGLARDNSPQASAREAVRQRSRAERAKQPGRLAVWRARRGDGKAS